MILFRFTVLWWKVRELNPQSRLASQRDQFPIAFGYWIIRLTNITPHDFACGIIRLANFTALRL
jgi:hypothetical protein